MKPTEKDLFRFIATRVEETGVEHGLKAPQAFPRWFAGMYYSSPQQFVHTDGAGDGKVDLFFHTATGNKLTYHVVNSKFTGNYGHTAPVGFYDEIISFYNLFV